jgi:hypothetical protein
VAAGREMREGEAGRKAGRGMPEEQLPDADRTATQHDRQFRADAVAELPRRCLKCGGHRRCVWLADQL